MHQRGMKVNKNKARAVLKARPPQTNQKLQKYLGRVNYLISFISNLAGKTKEFFDLLKLKQEARFKWEEK